jgi:hypothetical protein
MARERGELETAVRDAYDSSVDAIDAAQDVLLKRDDQLEAAIGALEEHLTRGLDDLRHGRPSTRDLRDFAEGTRRLIDQLRDARNTLRGDIETLSGRGSLDAIRALLVDIRTGEFAEP